MANKANKTATSTNLSPELEQLRVLTELGVDADTAWRQICESRDAREQRAENHANRSAQRLEETEQVIALLGGVAPAVEAAALGLLKVRDVARKGNLEHMVSSAKAELEVTRMALAAEAEGKKAKREEASEAEAAELQSLRAKLAICTEIGIELTPEQKAEMLGLDIPRPRLGGGLIDRETTETVEQGVNYNGNLDLKKTVKTVFYTEAGEVEAEVDGAWSSREPEAAQAVKHSW